MSPLLLELFAARGLDRHLTWNDVGWCPSPYSFDNERPELARAAGQIIRIELGLDEVVVFQLDDEEEPRRIPLAWVVAVDDDP